MPEVRTRFDGRVIVNASPTFGDVVVPLEKIALLGKVAATGPILQAVTVLLSFPVVVAVL